MIDNERYKKWVALRTKDIEDINDCVSKIQQLTSANKSPEVQEAMHVLLELAGSKKADIRKRMREVKDKLGLPKYAKQEL